MAHAHGAAPLPEPGSQPLRQVDGAMAAAGAADGDSEIAFPLSLEARQERIKERAEIAEEAGEIGVGGDIGADLAIEPGLRLKGGHIVRVPQETCVEDDIGITR